MVLKDIFFPAQCFGCATEGEFVCQKCFQALDCSGVFCCPECHVEVGDGKYCLVCETADLDSHISVIQYSEDSIVGKILHAFKYQYIEDVKNVLEKMINNFFNLYEQEVDMIIPVPLHKRRYVERGFNQSDIIANIVSNIINSPVENILIRRKYTKQQARLKRLERLKNLENAFVLRKKVDVRGKKILLVDDVFTTGSTIQECAKVLKDAGAREVIGFSVARG